MKKILFVVVMMSLAFCKNNPEEKPVLNKKPASVESVVYDPAKAKAEKAGVVTIGDGHFEIIQRYTNEVAFTQHSTDEAGKKQSYRYREMEVLAVNLKSKDTIVIRRSDFKPFFKGATDRDSLIMQSAILNQRLKKRIFPLMVDLCIPDTDVCATFEVMISNGKATFTQLGEDVLEEED